MSARMLRDLEAADAFLSNETDLNDSLTYQSCMPSSQFTIATYLHDEASSLAIASSKSATTVDERRKQKHEWKVNLYNSVESLFEFFFHRNSKGPTIDQFWGAVHVRLGVRKGATLGS